MAFTLVPLSDASQATVIATDVQREVHVNEYGLVTITDTITIQNLGLDPLFHVWGAYPLTEIKHLQYFAAETEHETSLQSQRYPLIGPNCTGWKIYLPEPVMPNYNFTFRTLMVLEGITEQDRIEARATFSPTPTSPYVIMSYDTILTYHAGISGAGSGPWSGGNITAFAYHPETVSMNVQSNNGKPLVTYLELKRIFTLDPWGYLFTQEIHTLRVDSINDEAWNWREKFQTALPPGSEYLRSYDVISNLSTRVAVPANLTEPGILNVDLQYHLKKGDVYQFTVEYRCPLDVYQLVLQNGQYLHFEPYYGHPWIIRHQIAEFILPPGSWLLGTSPGAETTITTTGQYLVRFQAYNVTSLHQSEVIMEYVYPIYSALSRPIVFAIVLCVLCLAYVIARRVPIFREEEEIITAVTEIDPVILGEFCSLYGEKVAILLQTERLEQRMLSGKIAKPRYRKERKNFERKLRALDKELQGRTQPLIEAGGKYESSCRQLELLEAERVSAIEALRALEERYRRKRITPSVYQKLRKDLEKRRDKAVGRMDRILIDLREEVSG